MSTQLSTSEQLPAPLFTPTPFTDNERFRLWLSDNVFRLTYAPQAKNQTAVLD